MFRRLLPVWALTLSCLVGCPSAPAPEKKPEAEAAPAVTATPDDPAVIQALKDAGGQLQLNKDKQVVAVDLTSVSMEDEAKATELLTDVAKLPELEVLRILGPGVNNETFKLVAGLKKLRVLELRNTKVNDEGAAIVAGFSNLTNLLARRTDFTDGALEKLAVLKNLRQLDLRFTNMSDAGMADLSGKFPNLTSLKLEGSKVTSKGVEPISQCTKLTELNLWGGGFDDASLCSSSR